MCQFLPTPLAWHFHQLPDWVQRLSAVAIITAEVVGALLMLSPVRGQRLVAFYSQVMSMMWMIRMIRMMMMMMIRMMNEAATSRNI